MLLSLLYCNCLEVRARIDVLRGVVVLIQRTLERIRWPIAGTALLLAPAKSGHQLVAFVLVLPASPDLPRYDEETSQDGDAGDTNYDTDDGGLCLGGYAGGFVGGCTVLQGAGRGASCRGRGV